MPEKDPDSPLSPLKSDKRRLSDSSHSDKRLGVVHHSRRASFAPEALPPSPRAESPCRKLSKELSQEPEPTYTFPAAKTRRLSAVSAATHASSIPDSDGLGNTARSVPPHAGKSSHVRIVALGPFLNFTHPEYEQEYDLDHSQDIGNLLIVTLFFFILAHLSSLILSWIVATTKFVFLHLLVVLVSFFILVALRILKKPPPFVLRLTLVFLLGLNLVVVLILRELCSELTDLRHLDVLYFSGLFLSATQGITFVWMLRLAILHLLPDLVLAIARSSASSVLCVLILTAACVACIHLTFLRERASRRAFSLLKQLETLTDHISAFEFDSIHPVPTTTTPDGLEVAIWRLLGVVQGLRPYLPDSLFLHDEDVPSSSGKLPSEQASAPGSPSARTSNPRTGQRPSLQRLTLTASQSCNFTPPPKPTSSPKFAPIAPLDSPAALPCLPPQQPQQDAFSTCSDGSGSSSLSLPFPQRIPFGRRALALSGITERATTVLVARLGSFERAVGMHPPAVIEALVREFLGMVFRTVKRHHGFVHTFSGCSLIATWNAVQPDGMHQPLACQCAFDIRSEWQHYTSGASPPAPSNPAVVAGDSAVRTLAVRLPLLVGLDTGACVVGHLGFEKSRAFHVLGVVPHCAALLAALNAQLLTTVLVSQAVHLAVSPRFRTRLVDRLQFDDDGTLMRVYELIGPSTLDESLEWMYSLHRAEQQNPHVEYETAFRKFSNGDVQTAQRSFREHQQNFPSDTHVARLLSVCQSMGTKLPNPYARRVGPMWQVFDGECPPRTIFGAP
eukprot:TRINITY_DN6049_c0_g1_i1.p1 TRINITY_DN6049_c0_g1~~TRINITY_DN6049_c0_g1_i1.p1  ORF type:complete len:799 (-),score=80.32 TRINITY_DN6049_c0_g1_i1:1-2361(-)